MLSAGDRPALVHDYLLTMRGAERVFAAIARCWPHADIYTLLYDPIGTDQWFARRTVRSSFLQGLGASQKGFRRLLPLFPSAAERLPVHDHDLVISSSSAFAHGVRPPEGVPHICYCHSPFRYAWHERQSALQEAPRPLRPLLNGLLNRIQRWDLAASRRVTHYVANSELTRKRIQDFWGHDAAVVHPPVETDRFEVGVAEDFFLFVGELVRHKRVSNAVRAASRAGVPLKVVGDGPELERLRALSGVGTEFLGRVSDAELAGLYPRARALIVPNAEEFGIAAVEAQAAGRPVVGADIGGLRETVIEGKTGVLVRPDDVDSLAEALAYTDFDRFSPSEIRAHACRFSPAAFRRRFRDEVDRAARAASAT